MAGDAEEAGLWNSSLPPGRANGAARGLPFLEVRVVRPASLAAPPPEFQKAESDLDYIQHKLEFEIMKSLPHSPSGEENPVTLLEELSEVKSRYKALCAQLEQVAKEQKESMTSICTTLDTTMKMVQQLQQQTNMELSPLDEEEQSALQKLRTHLTHQASKGTDLHKAIVT
ncbi:spindle and kinetochore-associated protein 2 isoform X2 [Ornithorhynchus anatinus]|uniref:spindle and kinetochore-associated protein 2 isoform X2 n=1 Tax=Ornithorhynchus anatinus TaxID=9258 RepID=UPI0019D4BA5C|nr:spindle and kinetochore-associated protein 2 isoform X2 [Ornithorhynchus anatinus]